MKVPAMVLSFSAESNLTPIIAAVSSLQEVVAWQEDVILDFIQDKNL